MSKPNVLVLAGHDPSGGAGLHADIEAIGANGAHAATVATLLTRQDTRDVHGVMAIDAAFFGQCVDTLTEDMGFAAMKTGVIGTLAQVDWIAAFKQRWPALPWVLDPVLRAAGGGALADDVVGTALRGRLFAQARLITPNSHEARLLCEGETDPERCGRRLAAYGCHVLITGGDEAGDQVVNHYYSPSGASRCFVWPRLPGGPFHGSGCTLASALAARFALGEDMETALYKAQKYTHDALAAAQRLGRGQAVPGRVARP